MKWLLLFLHLFLFHFPSFSCLNFLCHHDEYSALLQFKSSFTMDTYSYCGDLSHRKTTTWKNMSDCCSWHGVTCDTVSGHVIGLNLGDECLKGILHPNSTLFHLSHLQTLNLSYNDLFHSNFHSNFGGFMSLTHLDLSFSCFQGEIPPQISHLSKIKSFHLSGNNDLVWKESTLKRLVQNATNLMDMFLDYTDMSSIKLNSIDFLFNHSSSLVTLSLKYTGLRRTFKKFNICLPSIQELYLSGYNDNLKSQLPELSCSVFLRVLDFSSSDFHGPISPSFSNLTHLTSLDFTENSLNGSISSLLLTLPRLISLHLSGNDFSGKLPISLSNLHHLISLDLAHNSFIGQIPDVFGGMTKLRELDLNSNNLEGQIPSSLFNLNQLVRLNCSHNNLVGPLIDKISGFQKLTDLILDNNLLNGTIPSSLLSLPCLKSLSLTNNRFTGHISAISSCSLEKLYLCNNKLQGNIPKSIFNLSNLNILCLSSNNLSGVVDLQQFSKLQNLFSLSLSHNSQLSLNIESSLSYNFTKLIELDLSSLSLNVLPKFLGKHSGFFSLDMSNNKLNGRVPNWLLETMNSLGFLNLSQNMFTSIDQIPLSSYQLSSVDLSYNLLQGELSASICNMSSLKTLNLAHNKFYGTLSNKFSNDSKLHNLNLYGNYLEDRLPKTLSHCKNLEVLNLGNNRIEDQFPDWLQSLKNLKVLVLRDNKLHGLIPNLRINCSFPSLIIFDISGNNFRGPLPKAYFKKFEAMKDKDARFLYMAEAWYYFYSHLRSTSYYYSVTVTIKGINSTLGKISTNYAIIDMSRNKFEGEISNVVGELQALIGLNLSHNRLNGIIPPSIGNMTNLESLDLSSNMLTSVIPVELSNLNFLEFLDLSNNHLVGEIPQGKQFNTFSNDSYKGNSGLCGLPLSKKCEPQQYSPPSPDKIWNEEKFGFGWKPVAIGYGCGFVFGIGLGYCMFLVGKPRWLVIVFGGKPKRRMKRRTRVRRTNGSTMDQMIQMS